jgi:hypothetical protein
MPDKKLFEAEYGIQLSELGWTPIPTYFGDSFVAHCDFKGKWYVPSSANPINVKGVAKCTLTPRTDAIGATTHYSLGIDHHFTSVRRPPGKIESLNTNLLLDPQSIQFVGGKTLIKRGIFSGAVNPTASTSSLNICGSSSLLQKTTSGTKGTITVYSGEKLLKK